jgi:Na+-transporting methylmalonyl-CoA/oxaloacetate decarboxylase beta subunit
MNKDLKGAKTIGIIGGADGPTTIFVENVQFSSLFTVVSTTLTIIGIAYLMITKRKKDNQGSDNQL